MQMTDNPCNLCGSSNHSVLANTDRDRAPLTTVICEDCGLVYTNPRPTEADIEDFYAKQYRLAYKGTYQPKAKHVHRAANMAMGRFATLADDYQGAKHVLDIGAGGGEYCYLLKCKGFNADGIEPNEGYAHYASHQYQLNIRVGCLANHHDIAPIYDVISLFHVFEHMCDPKTELARMKAICKPGGKIIIEVPNMEACKQLPQHKFHFAHLYNFNLNTLRAIGEEVGLSIHRSFISDDTCSITVIFKNTLPKHKTVSVEGNAAKIKGIYQNHTAMSYYLSKTPYRRFADKFIAYAREFLAANKFENNSQLIDALYAKEHEI